MPTVAGGSGGGAGGLVTLKDNTVSGSAVTSVDFTGLSISPGSKVYITMNMKMLTVLNGGYLYINNDTTAANYENRGVKTTPAYSQSTAPWYWWMEDDDEGVGDGFLGVTPSGYVRGWFNSTRHGSSDTDVGGVFHYAYNVSIASITQLTFTAYTATTIDVGSRITIQEAVV